jgi:O-antigen/teichoic acid export membrane protein
LVTAFLPAIIHGKTISEELYNARLKRLAGLLLLLSLSIGCIVSIFAPLIIKLIYGSAFFESIPILRIYIWAGVGIFIGTLTANYLITENQKEALLFNSLIPMVSNIVLNLLWIPTYGIVGSAYATLISYILGPLSILLFKENRQRLFSMCFGPKVRKI